MFTTPLFAATAPTLSLSSRASFTAVATTGCTAAASMLAKRDWNHTHIYGGGPGDSS